MRSFIICLLFVNFLAAKHFLVEVDGEDKEDEVSYSDYAMGHDPELLNEKLKKMWLFSC